MESLIVELKDSESQFGTVTSKALHTHQDMAKVEKDMARRLQRVNGPTSGGNSTDTVMSAAFMDIVEPIASRKARAKGTPRDNGERRMAKVKGVRIHLILKKIRTHRDLRRLEDKFLTFPLGIRTML